MTFYNERYRGLTFSIGPFTMTWTRIIGVQIGPWFFGAIRGTHLKGWPWK